MIVLDTNIISEVMRPAPELKVMAWLRQQPLTTLAVTTVTMAEIHYGLERLPAGRRRQTLEARFQMFIERGFDQRLLFFDDLAAVAYGKIVANRVRQGRLIEAFDAMIAAIAQVNHATVATRDVSGFEHCGVDIINPWEIELPANPED